MSIPVDSDELFNGLVEVPTTDEVIWVEGVDAVPFLQGLVSQDVEAMASGEAAATLFLGPQGKLEAVLWLLRGEERVGILTDGEVPDMVAALGHYRIRVKAEIRRDDRSVGEMQGSGVHNQAGLTPATWAERDGVLEIALDDFGEQRLVSLGSVPPRDVRRLTAIEADARRILRGRPRFGVDIDQSTIPQESGLVPRSVSFTKGCFLGQELVARIDSRGRVNRHLRHVALDRPVEAGSVVRLGDRDAGTLTSVTGLTDPVLGLGLLRREAEPGSEVVVEARQGPVLGVVRSIRSTEEADDE